MRRTALVPILICLLIGSARSEAGAPDDASAGQALLVANGPAAPWAELPDAPSSLLALTGAEQVDPGATQAAPGGTSPPGVGAPPSTNELHMPASYRPAWAVTRTRLGDKLAYGSASLLSVRNLVEALLITGVPNLPSAPTQPDAPALPVTIPAAEQYQQHMRDWGDAIDGWRRVTEDLVRYREHRMETGLATAESRQFLSALTLPILLHQDAAYRPAPIDASMLARLSNAAESIIVTHSDHGRLVPNYSKLGGTFAAGFLGKAAFSRLFDAPELNSGRFLVKYVGYSLAGDLATNLTRELLRATVEQDVEVYHLHARSTQDSYYPLSAGAKFVYWGRSTYAGRNFVQAFVTAGIPNIADQPKEPRAGRIVTQADALAFDNIFINYGNALQYWRRHIENDVRYHEHRLIGGMAASESQQVIQNLIIPMTLGIDPRYIPLGRSYDSGTRLGHAFRGLVEARTDAGGRTINLPVLLGTTGGALLAKEVYYPALGTPALETSRVLVTTILLNLAADLVGNIHSEFFRHRGY